MLCALACLTNSVASREKLACNSCRRCGAIAAVGIFGMAGMPGIDGNMDWMLPPPGKPAKPGMPPKAANGFAAAVVDPEPGFACAASFCHEEGSATERHVLSHCSNIFCTAAGSAPATPNGVLDVVV